MSDNTKPEAVFIDKAAAERIRNNINRILAEDTANDRITELEAIVEKLPKTVDGVSVGPGTSTYGPNHAGEIVEWKWGVMPWYNTEQLQHCFRDTYSTRAAAEAAREKGEQP